MSTMLIETKGKRILLNVQYSGIGSPYPRLFVEINPEEYINCDLTIGAAFNMKKKNFEDWLEDAEVIPEADHQKVLTDNGINYDGFMAFVGSLDKEGSGSNEA